MSFSSSLVLSIICNSFSLLFNAYYRLETSRSLLYNSDFIFAIIFSDFYCYYFRIRTSNYSLYFFAFSKFSLGSFNCDAFVSFFYSIALFFLKLSFFGDPKFLGVVPTISYFRDSSYFIVIGSSSYFIIYSVEGLRSLSSELLFGLCCYS